MAFAPYPERNRYCPITTKVATNCHVFIAASRTPRLRGIGQRPPDDVGCGRAPASRVGGSHLFTDAGDFGRTGLHPGGVPCVRGARGKAAVAVESRHRKFGRTRHGVAWLGLASRAREPAWLFWGGRSLHIARALLDAVGRCGD